MSDHLKMSANGLLVGQLKFGRLDAQEIISFHVGVCMSSLVLRSECGVVKMRMQGVETQKNNTSIAFGFLLLFYLLNCSLNIL